VLGSAWAFAAAILIIVVWAVTGPAFHYSDTWLLIINTVTTIVTFLMVFLIQNTQNRDAKAAHLKLDEIIRALKGARNELVDLENFPTKTSPASRNSSSAFAKRQSGTATILAG
jgi:low affinity Fe/Cu permease